MSAPDRGTVFSGPVQGSVVGDSAIVTMIFQNGTTRPVDMLRLLNPIDENRMKAEDWKSLHEDFQRISLRLVRVRAIAAREEDPWVLHDLEDHWTHECKDCIQTFIDLERLPERAVRRDFVIANEKGGWLAQLRSYSLEMEGAIGRCVEAEDLRIHLREMLDALLRLEGISARLLSFLDSRLQRVIKEMDQAIAQARWDLTVPPNATQPGAPS